MTDIETLFNEARKLYPGDKRGFDFEWNDFRRWHRMKCPEFVPLLLPAIKDRIAYFDACDKANMWHKQWQGFKTWTKNGHWTDTMPKIKTNTLAEKKCQFCGDPSTVYIGGKGHRCSSTECRAKFDSL